MRALNIWTTWLHLPAFEDILMVQNVYPTAHPGASGSGPEHVIVASQHCELTVGLHLWKLLRDRKERSTVEIGCSKQSCFYCRLLIDKFNEWAAREEFSYRIVVRGHHNKFVQGWAMPSGPPAVRNSVLDAIGEVIRDIYHQVGGPRRRSDSQSPPSGSQEATASAEMMAAAKLGGDRLY
ncbi:MAG: hypothetical protein LQ337_003564 [Flavoplaca oasis]|nr:MAG: hypothetical protein LQ337_003564 [Flavoplaca oasis]